MDQESTQSPIAVSVKTRNIPETDLDFSTVINKVNQKWLANKNITLLWTTQAQFSTKADLFKTALTERIQTGGSRPQLTQSLKNLNKQIDDNLIHIKGYLAEKYGKEDAISYYKAFGIEHSGKRYSFPKDQDRRSKALEMITKAITANGFAQKTYGTTYWTNLKTQYDTLLDSASKADGTVSNKVGDKNTLKKELKKVLNSIIYSVKANYPETYKQELRAWGFQKEKY